MNRPILYQWSEMIDKAFPHLGRWQRLTLALFSYGGAAGAQLHSEYGGPTGE